MSDSTQFGATNAGRSRYTLNTVRLPCHCWQPGSRIVTEITSITIRPLPLPRNLCCTTVNSYKPATSLRSVPV